MITHLAIFFGFIYLCISLFDLVFRWWHKRKQKMRDKIAAANFRYQQQSIAQQNVARTMCKHPCIIRQRGEPTIGDYINCKSCGARLTEEEAMNAAVVYTR